MREEIPRQGRNSFWERLYNLDPKCTSERLRVSALSPGPVLSYELVVSAVESAAYVGEDNKISPTFFDNRMSTGLSVDRVLHTTPSAFEDRVQQRISGNSKKSYQGVVVISVSTIRKSYEGGSRCFGVHDTALDENRAHGEISQTNHPPDGTPDRTRMRALIRSSALSAIMFEKKVVPAADAFGKV